VPIYQIYFPAVHKLDGARGAAVGSTAAAAAAAAAAMGDKAPFDRRGARRYSSHSMARGG